MFVVTICLRTDRCVGQHEILKQRLLLFIGSKQSLIYIYIYIANYRLLVFEDTIVRVCVPVSPTHVGIPCCVSGSSNKTVIARDHDVCMNNVMKNESNFHDPATGCYTETCCDHYAYKHWVESGAYAPKLGSPLASVCPVSESSKKSVVRFPVGH